MKIRIFISLFGESQGGLQVLALRLAQHLKKLGHDVRIMGRFTHSPAVIDHTLMEDAQVFTVNDVEVEIMSIRRWRLRLLHLVPRLVRHRKSFAIGRAAYRAAFQPLIDRAIEGADVVHYFGTGWEMLGLAVMARARRKNIPFVVEPALHVGQRGDGPADWLLYRGADLVVAHSKFEAEAYRRKGIEPAHVHVLRHGFDALAPGDGNRFRKAHGIDGPMILFVGRRSDDKGYFLLLEAFAILRRQMPRSTLVIVGVGVPPPSTAEGVLELGRVPDEVRQDALDACTVFCMPSKGESFGMAYFEAWNCSRPVVALDLPVLRETIGVSGGGYLAGMDNVPDLAEKLRLLLSNPELATAMGARGREFSLRYSWTEAAKSCLEGYAQARENLRP